MYVTRIISLRREDYIEEREAYMWPQDHARADRVDRVDKAEQAIGLSKIRS